MSDQSNIVHDEQELLKKNVTITLTALGWYQVISLLKAACVENPETIPSVSGELAPMNFYSSHRRVPHFGGGDLVFWGADGRRSARWLPLNCGPISWRRRQRDALAGTWYKVTLPAGGMNTD